MGRVFSLFFILVVVLLVMPLALASPTSSLSSCKKGCSTWGLACCLQWQGLGDHRWQWDAIDNSMQCWSDCKTPVVEVQKPTPDYAVTDVSVLKIAKEIRVTALIENKGDGSLKNGDLDDFKIIIAQRLQRLPLWADNQDRSVYDVYSVSKNGQFNPGDKHWLNELPATMYTLMPGNEYLYSVELQPGFLPDKNTANNKVRVRLTVKEDGSTVIRWLS